MLTLVMAGVMLKPAAVEAAGGFALVELFASEGCSSCPPADELLRALTAQAKKHNQSVFTLSFQVDYWNNLGWVDPFSKPEFTQRQYWYAKLLPTDNVYTPQMVINGRVGFVGSDSAKASALINEALARQADCNLSLQLLKADAHTVTLAYKVEPLFKDAVLNAALVENNIESRPNAGENAGAVLKHDHVVRQWQSIPLPGAAGTVKFNDVSLPQPANYSVIIFLQDVHNGHILAANGLDLI